MLSKHGIDVLINNPGVGENLQDHVLAVLAYEIEDPSLSLDSLRDPALLKTALESFQAEKSGPSDSGVQASKPVHFFRWSTLSRSEERQNYKLS